MHRFIRYSFLFFLISVVSCREVLEPQPVNLLIDELVLNQAQDVPSVRIGLYSALRATASPTIIAGDFTADYIQHNGTFNDYRELATKQITAANGAVNELWGTLYRAIYVANFLQEKLPLVASVPQTTREQVLAEARFIRGYANFILANTYGDVPLVTTTEQAANRTVARTAKAEVLAAALADFKAASAGLPDVATGSLNVTTNATYINKVSCRAMLARYYLYQGNWAAAEDSASAVISNGTYALEANYPDLVTRDFTREAIIEVGYNLSDDPGTSNGEGNQDIGLNNLLVGRREVIPSNQLVAIIASLAETDTRRSMITFNAQNQRGSDNGWTVRKYGTASEDNNNIVLMRLAEMYLIRAEARAQQGKLNGVNGAVADLNVLRTRAKAPAIAVGSQADVLLAVERERVYELAFEGHRWYDLVRTGRAQAVMSAFSPNWNSRYERWPIPQREIQQNPALAGQQNPGY